MSIDLTEVFAAEREERLPNWPGRIYRKTLQDEARPLVIAGDCWLIAYMVELCGDEETFYVYASTREGALAWLAERAECIEPIAEDGDGGARFWIVGKRFRRLATLTYVPKPKPPRDRAELDSEWLAWCRQCGVEWVL
jgi:hypothetical protein